MNSVHALSIEETYREANRKSQVVSERALGILPGGNTRTTVFFDPYPFYFDYGVGCRVYDIDENERLDFINNYTSLMLGHSHPNVVAAVHQQVGRGMSVAAPTELEVALGETLQQRLPSLELLRFTNS